ncbi:hypothetical protein C900_02812 [Fulvivirga imtechensis AK7]|uniref:Uncharacterized protein n=1 Tax=Fulvivirga imtechensis AK7 TaxID=1237149 RepID=L8JUV5_9BACT|nr:hypothetical protein [Fulvivirga imtechensis]ELR71354.1 hypothetical protein C900_02812 [Fulvivirga imtechensis AK7]
MKINVPEKYADLYLKALGERKKALEAKITDFRREIEEIDNHISALTSLPIFNDAPYSPMQLEAKGYQPEWPWTRKITYYQDFKQKLFIASEIVDFIIEKEPALNKSKVRSSISAALSNRHKSGHYIKFTDPVTGSSYYGPSDWFINEQEPHLKHLPDDLKNRLLGS